MATRVYIMIAAVILSTLCSSTISSREPKTKSRPNQRFIIRLSEQDAILPITSIEWGYPDRWSFTSRYIHSLEKERKRRTWHNNIGISLSPGLSGGRLGVGYLGIYSPPSLREFALFTELRGILLRTWKNPISADPDTTYAGAELKLCISWLLNVGVGYYLPITDSNNNKKAYWGFHVGIGI